ncbi:MAG: hypothetical protein SV062_11110 [Thermodesulfobacteriota bacterium]|nr:hypothetical protein [Thermodesulfobacteriota bacterium]
MIDFAMENYQKMLSPSVDQKLVSKLLPITSKIEGEDFFNYFKRLKDSAKKGSVYKGYEEFVKHLDYVVQLLSSDQKKKIESAVIELLPAFKIQKAIYLESLAKWLVWNKWYKKAIKVYQELIDFKPGNEEAYFDCAQVECILGLCDIEGKTYQNLLNIDPLHSLARKALERQNIRSNPSVDLMHWYWKEEGRDDLAQITRNRTDLALDIPIFCRYHLRIVGHRWLEDPQSKSGSFAANGHTLGFNGILSPHIKLETGWTNKNYTDEEFRTRDTGYAYVWFNLRDHALLGLGYDKTNELYNYFGIKQGIQADSWWISGALNITRQLEIELKTKYLDYKDHNEGNRYFVSASYQFTDHPRIFKITLSGKYLDTERTSLFKYEGDTLIDIIHPYWAPESHKAGNIIFEWYHDISKFLFCGSELHFYDLRLGYGNETENNHSVQFEGEWHYEFYNHWIYSIKGLLHRSRDWDSEAVWAMLKYQF